MSIKKSRQVKSIGDEGFASHRERRPSSAPFVCPQVMSELTAVFPLSFQALGEDRFKKLLSAFLLDRQKQAVPVQPHSRDLHQFVSQQHYSRRWRLPYLDDLMRYESIEIQLSGMPERPIPEFSLEGDFQYLPLVLNPHHRLDRFAYPVFRLPPAKLARKQGLYFLVSYRHFESKKVEFIELSAPFALALERLAFEAICGNELWEWIGQHFPHVKGELASDGRRFLETMMQKGLILGFKRQLA